MPETLSPEAPSLRLAVGWLRRTLWVWAAMFAALAGLQWFALQRAPDPVALIDAIGLMLVALVIALDAQPVYLALVAVVWGTSLVRLVPGVAAVFGPDVLVALVGDSWLEQLAAAIVRLLLLVTAWNQFMLYRLLYGTAQFRDADPEAPILPEVVANRAPRLANAGRWMAAAALALALGAIPLADPIARALALNAALVLATIALGLGVGAAFSPLPRRAPALQAAVIAAAAYLLALLVGAWSAT
jgi:hypothetical protein